MKKLVLYVIGIGPGDPELITLKAVRIIRDTPCIIVPKGREEGSSLALSILQGAVDVLAKDIQEAYFPMLKTKDKDVLMELDTKWDAAARSIIEALNRHGTAVFITLGDPAIYSTFFYVYERIKRLDHSIDVRFIPGISSINAAASSVVMSLTLGDEKMAVVPATYADKELKEIISGFDTVVLMKVHRVFDRIVDLLKSEGLLHRAVYVSQAGTKDERICRDIDTLQRSDLSYFSLIVVKK